MKTPKFATPNSKSKVNTPKSGLIKKSLGSVTSNSLKKFFAKGSDEALSLIKNAEDSVEFKSKAPKAARMSLPVNTFKETSLSPSSTPSFKSRKFTPKSFEKKKILTSVTKSGKKGLNEDDMAASGTPKTVDSLKMNQGSAKKTPLNERQPQSIKTPPSVENNTSPVKQTTGNKQAKIPFKLNDSMVDLTPTKQKDNLNKALSPKSKHSPEVELGLKLEQALSPKSKKEKKKQLALKNKLNSEGKTEVKKKNAQMPSGFNGDVNVGSTAAGKKRKRRHRGKRAKKSAQPSILKHVNVMNAANALLKTSKPKQKELLDTDQYIYLQFNLVKLSQRSTGVYKIVLPHSILPENPEVCLISADLKGKKNQPEEAIDSYTELLKQNGVTGVTEVLPVRKLKQEYSQYEELQKLSNRFDMFLCDGRISKVVKLGRRFARSKRCLAPIQFNSNKSLKEQVDKALKKVAIFASGNGTSHSVKCGRVGMSAEQIADNVVTIGEFLANDKLLVGEPANVSSVYIKTALSKAFPVYVSTVTPNEVHKPKGKDCKLREPVEGEVSTLYDATVVVHPSGNVKVKKRKSDNNEGEEEKGKKQKLSKELKQEVDKVKETTSKLAKTTNKGKIMVEEEDSDEDDSDLEQESDQSDEATSGEEDEFVSGEEDEFASGEEDEVASDDDEEPGSDEELGSDIEEASEGEDNSLVDGDENEDNEDDSSMDEADIEAAEAEYLQELRQLQDEFSKGIHNKKAGKKQQGGNKKLEQDAQVEAVNNTGSQGKKKRNRKRNRSGSSEVRKETEKGQCKGTKQLNSNIQQQPKVPEKQQKGPQQQPGKGQQQGKGPQHGKGEQGHQIRDHQQQGKKIHQQEKGLQQQNDKRPQQQGKGPQQQSKGQQQQGKKIHQQEKGLQQNDKKPQQQQGRGPQQQNSKGSQQQSKGQQQQGKKIHQQEKGLQQNDKKPQQQQNSKGPQQQGKGVQLGKGPQQQNDKRPQQQQGRGPQQQNSKGPQQQGKGPQQQNNKRPQQQQQGRGPQQQNSKGPQQQDKGVQLSKGPQQQNDKRPQQQSKRPQQENGTGRRSPQNKKGFNNKFGPGRKGVIVN